jgi:hypothetical protein
MRSYLEEVDFETIKQRFDAFWDGEVLDRPLICITTPKKRQKSIDFLVPESIIDRWRSLDYVLKKMELYFENTLFLGEAIPWYLPNIGPDSFTSFLGANLSFRSEETSWAEPFLEDLSGYEPVFANDGKWWRFMERLLDAVCEVAEGNFLVGIPDIHYGGDSLVATVGAQRLIRHIFSNPEDVKRLVGRLTEICCAIFDHYYEKISRVQKGSITWIPAYSRGRYFALQDDFSGLVSPRMFEEFFVEEVERLSKYLDNSLYHLDGPLAIGNLDRLLEIDSLDGIQWVPGAGARPMSEWTDLCAKVLDADKCLQIACTPDKVESLLSKLKHGGLFLSTHCSSETEARSVLRIAERYHR